MRFITVKEVMVIHDLLIEDTGGSDGIRDRNLLHSAIERPKAGFEGVPAYPDIYHQAAALLHSLVFNHAFVDGNKRTAITTTSHFFELNGYQVIVKKGQLWRFVVRVVEKRLQVEDIAIWLEQNTRER